MKLDNRFIPAFIFLFMHLNISAQKWININTPVSDNLILWDMCFPENQSNIGYAGGSNYTYNGKAHIMKTIDNGLTWDLIYSNAVSNTGIMSLHFTSVNNGFAGTMGGDLLKTSDGGIQWTAFDIDLNIDQGELNAIDFFDANNAVVSTSLNGIYYTEDGGVNWIKSTTSISGILAVSYASKMIVFAVGVSQNIYKSEDGGDTWINVFTGNNPSNYNLGINFLDESNGIVTSEEGEVFITSNSGQSWASHQFVQGGLINDALMLSNNIISVACTPGQVFNSANGGVSWNSDSSSWDLNKSFYKIEVTPNGTQIVCGSGSNGGTVLRKEGNPLNINNKDILEWKISPNPVCNRLLLNFKQAQSAAVSIYNSSGLIILNDIINQANFLDINTSNLPSGVYIVSLKLYSGITYKKFIKS